MVVISSSLIGMFGWEGGVFSEFDLGVFLVMEEMSFFLEEMDRGRRFRKEEAEMLPKKPVSIDSAVFDFIVVSESETN